MKIVLNVLSNTLKLKQRKENSSENKNSINNYNNFKYYIVNLLRNKS